MPEIAHPTFADHCLISCGMLRPEIDHLMEVGFLNPRKVLFTPPGLHALPGKLEEHLLRRLTQARESCPDHRIVVIYGKKCYVNTDAPLKRVDSILQAAGEEIVRVRGEYGYDMLAGFEDRQRISGIRASHAALWYMIARRVEAGSGLDHERRAVLMTWRSRDHEPMAKR